MQDTPPMDEKNRNGKKKIFHFLKICFFNLSAFYNLQIVLKFEFISECNLDESFIQVA